LLRGHVLWRPEDHPRLGKTSSGFGVRLRVVLGVAQLRDTEVDDLDDFLAVTGALQKDPSPLPSRTSPGSAADPLAARISHEGASVAVKVADDSIQDSAGASIRHDVSNSGPGGSLV
jgi:hypothetical protein